MQNFVGVGVFRGRVIGPVRHMPPALAEPPAGERLDSSTAPKTAAASFKAAAFLKAAAATVKAELLERAGRAAGAGKEVLEATALMATDPMLVKAAVKLINAGTTPERAIWEAGGSVADMLKNLGGYMAERSHDVLDVRSRNVALLRGVPAPVIPDAGEPFILVAEDLAPADTATLDPLKVIALVPAGGGRSHSPPLLTAAWGCRASLPRPWPSGGRRRPCWTSLTAPGSLPTAPWSPCWPMLAGPWTPSRRPLPTHREWACCAPNSASWATAPNPATQTRWPPTRVSLMPFPCKRVVVRTPDAGADKPLPFLTDSAEPNPALGVRGYRTDLTTPGVLARQLAAIADAAASSGADVRVMAPMISTSAEAADFAALCTAAGLRIPGVMVEVPSAALTSRHILDHVEFASLGTNDLTQYASLGTNDLTQYAMAADRQLGTLAGFNDPWQPAVLALVQAIVEGAVSQAKHSPSLEQSSPKPVGVCGGSAADPALAVVLAGLGVSTLSMTPRALPAVAAVLRTVTLAQAQALAHQAVVAASAGEARGLVRAGLPALAELGL